MADTNRRNHDSDRDRERRAYDRERDESEQVDLLGISRRDKRLHGSVYALIILVWVGIVAWNTIESDCWSSQQPRTSCIIDAVGSIDKAVFPALMLTIALIALGRSGRAAFRRTLMVLPVLRDTYAENLQAARAEGAEREKTRAKEWYERKQRAEENGEPFNEPPPWEK